MPPSSAVRYEGSIRQVSASPATRHLPDRVDLSNWQNNKQTDFINIVAWRHTAEFVGKYFTKGQLVAVEGSIQTRSYQDKDGNNRTAFEVVADQVYFAERKASSTPSGNNFVPPPFEEPAKGSSFSVGDLGDFEEFDADDSELPF